MKKTLLFIISLISIFAFTKVYAEGPFYFDWETQSYENREPREHISYKDGYITSDYAENKTILSRYDADGKLVNSKNFNYEVYGIKADDNNIYAMAYKNETGYVMLLDENFNIVEQIERIAYDIKITEENIMIDGSEHEGNNWYYYVYTYEKDLSSFTKKEYNSKDWFGVNFDPLYDYLDNHYNYNNSIGMWASDYKDNLMVNAETFVDRNQCTAYNGANIGGGGHDVESVRPGNRMKMLGNEDEESCYHTYIGLYKANGTTLWEKELKDYIAVGDAKFVNEYIVAIGIREDSSDIIVFDMEGNIIQTINSTKGFVNITATNGGFAVDEGFCYDIPNYVLGTGGEPLPPGKSPKPTLEANLVDLADVGNPFASGERILVGCSCIAPWMDDDSVTYAPKPTSNVILTGAQMCTFKHQFYYLYHLIEPKITEGKGNIEVASHGKPGEPVTFVVTPEEGYTLGVIKVTTADGEVLTFTNYTFTMPTADVTIEATFLKTGINPKTADIAIIGVLLASLISLGLFFVQKKRLKELK